MQTLPLLTKYVVRYYSTVSSTIDVAKEWLSDITDNKKIYVVCADEQVQGRGRDGRYWHSPRGGLYTTFILPHTTSIPELTQYSFVAAVSLGQFLKSLSSQICVRYKWPNDVLVSGKKIAGILLENDVFNGQQFLLMSIGLNLVHNFEHMKGSLVSTSLLKELGLHHENKPILRRFISYFEHYLTLYEHEGFAPIRALWLQSTYPVGSLISWNGIESCRKGTFCGMDKDGALVVKDDKGDRLSILAGEVFFHEEDRANQKG